MMKFAQSAILLSLLVVFFVGNIGVNVFKHICHEDGVSVSYIVNRGDEHCDKHQEKAQLPPCCHPEVEDEMGACCDDEVYYYKLQVDAEQHAAFDFQGPALLAVLPEIYHFEFLNYPETRTLARFEDPPPISGREILIQKQVWNL